MKVRGRKIVLERDDLLPELRGSTLTITVRRPFGVLSWRRRLAWLLMRLGVAIAAAGVRLTGVRCEKETEEP